MKKQGNIVFALIISLSSSELKQFKRFLKFEFTKATPYLKMVSFIEKYPGFDFQNEAFPEDVLIKKCGTEVEKNYTKLKSQLKQSAERFLGYLALKNEPKKDSKFLSYFFVKSLMTYVVGFRLFLPHDLDVQLEALAKEANNSGYFGLSNMLYLILLHNISFMGKAKSIANDRAREIKKIMAENELSLKDKNQIAFYKSIFVNCKDSFPSIDDEINDFKKLELNFSDPKIQIEYYQTKSFLAIASQDYKTDLDNNLEILKVLKKAEKLPLFLLSYNFSARINGHHAAMRINDKEFAYRLLEEANDYIQNTEELLPNNLKSFYGYYLDAKLLYILKFEENKSIIKSFILKMGNAMDNDEVLLSPLQQNISKSRFLIAYFVTGDYSKCYDLGYEYMHKDNLSSLALICYLLSQFQQFDIDFLDNSFRSIGRTTLENASLPVNEKKTIKTILSKLKKLKENMSRDESLILEIEQLILTFEDDFTLVHQRIAKQFKKMTT